MDPKLPPELELSWGLMNALCEAYRAAGRLAGRASAVRGTELLTPSLVRIEAIHSSRLAGIPVSARALAVFEAEGQPASAQSDLREAASYAAALKYGLRQLQELPLSLRFIREVHERLLLDARGNTQAAALDAFETYLQADSELPLMIRAAIIHYHFEAIHPFLDGNGRVGRLITTFLLHGASTLDQPLLYLSAYFDRNRDEYHRLLLKVSSHGAWLEWILFFLRGVKEQADDAVARSGQLLALHQSYLQRVTSARSSGLLQGLLQQLFENPATTIPQVASRFGITYVAAKKNIDKLVAWNVLREMVDGRRPKVYLATEIIEILEA